VGAIAAYGAGALVGAIAFDLVPESARLSALDTSVWLLIGGLVFAVADRFVDSRFGGDGGATSGGNPIGIVVGSVVDGVPESVIFGIGVATGLPLSLSFLAAVFISNVPQALAPSADLAKTWPPVRLAAMWLAVVLVCGLAAAVGYASAVVLPAETGARAAAFAAGGLLAMLTDSLIPFAYEKGGIEAGVFTVVGFAVALAAAG
ncbi:MAG: hypothetical protein ACJ761_00640, partial [Chloroflexota bacterium]